MVSPSLSQVTLVVLLSLLLLCCVEAASKDRLQRGKNFSPDKRLKQPNPRVKNHDRYHSELDQTNRRLMEERGAFERLAKTKFKDKSTEDYDQVFLNEEERLEVALKEKVHGDTEAFVPDPNAPDPTAKNVPAYKNKYAARRKKRREEKARQAQHKIDVAEFQKNYRQIEEESQAKMKQFEKNQAQKKLDREAERERRRAAREAHRAGQKKEDL
eukprot:TRINITY_DN1918_c0_g1_i1.p1 TRINITY_DN1918_c0_g1~~TRINITY_DN1918_c0_g1_i1.p1  ORF type:complete len:214 (-),score=57.76 TRINITY_DN1918_c0_g1_i1:77-718(-)